MRAPYRIPTIAILLIVLLRLSIGWQFLYEGLWKLDSMSTTTPWTAAGFLNNAQGPFREQFRQMTGDPNELNWVDYEKMEAKWNGWAERFKRHYGLNEKQIAELDELLVGPERKNSRQFKMPEGISLDKTTFEYDEEKQILSFPAWEPPTPTDFARLFQQLPDEPENMSPEEMKLFDELERLQDLAVRLSYKQKLAGMLKGDPGVTGVVFIQEEETGDRRFEMRPQTQDDENIVKVGDKEVYLEMLADYDNKLKTADQDFEFDHLQTLWGKIQEQKNTLVGPVKDLEKELKEDARKLLTYEQIARGPVPVERTKINQVNQLTIWSLLILGVCLIAGFATRIAAVAGAGMLMSFYLVWPPWPGVPEAPGPEHALWVNKNSIEAVALLAIALLPTGRWFGVDALLGALFWRKKK
ncbi:MAG: DoxX family protein [Planctomycetaceae bacterium]|nr:DoxX family protein [Planctomycetaceae bacterium]